MFSHARLRRRASVKLLRKQTLLLFVLSLCAVSFIWYVHHVKGGHNDDAADEMPSSADEDGELGVDYEWVAVYTDAKGVEREVPVVQRRDGVILLNSFNFYSVVNFDVYREAFILWIVHNSDLCDDAERALSTAVQQLVSPIHGQLRDRGNSTEKRQVLYAQFLVDVNDEDHQRLVKTKGLNSNDFPTMTVVFESTSGGKSKQVTVGYSGPLSADGLLQFDPRHPAQVHQSASPQAEVVFENGILQV